MSNHCDYEISIPSGTPNTKQEFIDLIKQHQQYFENAFMSNYAHDKRYTYFGENLEVSDIEYDPATKSGSFTVSADIEYYEGCKDKDSVESEDLSVDYKIINEAIHFTLDETVWRTE
jgi:hypothetical protein